MSAVVILAVVSTVSLVTINKQKNKIQETKLRHQLGATHSAVQAYKMSGGQLEGVTTSGQGAPGIEEFGLGEPEADAEDSDSRKLSTELATKDSWIWDYTDGPGDFLEGVKGDFDRDESITLAVDGIGQSPVATPLLPPSFSLAVGTRDFAEFSDLQLVLANPNEQSFSAIYY